MPDSATPNNATPQHTAGEGVAWANAVCAELSTAQAAAGAESGLAGIRSGIAAFVSQWPGPAGVERDQVEVGGLVVHRFRTEAGTDGGRLLYVHGGGFTTGSGGDYIGMLGRLAHEAAVEVLACDYRLAPEHPFPAALEDVTSILAALTSQPAPLAVAGDSAGGALTVASILRLIRSTGVRPYAVALLSPLLDLTPSTPSYQTNENSDPMLNRRSVEYIARTYLSGTPREDPEASPLRNASFEGFPPTAVYASTSEVLRDDAVRLAARLGSDGVPVRLQLEPGVPHVWPMFGDALDVSRRTLEDVAAFLRVARTW